ncbi:MAG: hypothetical protein IT580_16215, partial [Verrucomicrobiales bacterium]|nr:hypothetical protein [Verrucomicrobiales bacterium]
MNNLHIHRLRARYHLPEAKTGSRARLDGLLARALHEVLAPEVERLALDPHEHVCLRRLEVPVRLRLSQGDAALARTWGESLTRAVQQALEGTDPEDSATARVEKVRYPSLLHALVDCAVGVSRHDLRHAWAWRQLELWRETDTVTPESALQEWVRALQRFPDHVVPVFHALAPSGFLRTLAPRLTANQWIALAAAALGASEVPLRASDLLAVSLATPASHRDPETATQPGPASGRSESSHPRSLGLPQNESTRTALDQLLSRSSLAAAVELQTLAPAARRAVCILMLLDADPGQAAHPRAVW